MVTSKFYLQNQWGQRRSLNIDGDVYFIPGGGLGITEKIDVANLQNGFYTATKSTIPQDSVVGDLVFKRGAYASYANLVNWTMEASQLDLIYVPQEADEYHRRVKMTSLTKTIRDSAGWCVMPVTFMCYTPWFLEASPLIEFTAGQSSAMRFPMVFNSNLRFSPSVYGTASAVLKSGGHMPASWVFQYSGYMVNPEITIVGYSSGTEYGKCAISGIINANDVLKISTQYLDSYVKQISSDGTETDLINASAVDIAYDPFARIPVDEDCVLKIEAENTLDGEAKLTANYYYRSV